MKRCFSLITAVLFVCGLVPAIANASDTMTPTESTYSKALEWNFFQLSVINEKAVVQATRDSIAATKNVNVSFGDTSTHWSKEGITKAVKLRIIIGYQDGTFHPDAAVTRAEFSAMVFRAFGLEVSKTLVAVDDTNAHWGASYMRTLASLDVVSGYADGSFKPDASISRAEMVTIFTRVLNFSLLAKGTWGSFTDVPNDYWAKDAIEQASSAQFIQGTTNTTFEPQKNATRAEALTLIIRALESNSTIKALIQGI